VLQSVSSVKNDLVSYILGGTRIALNRWEVIRLMWQNSSRWGKLERFNIL